MAQVKHVSVKLLDWKIEKLACVHSRSTMGWYCSIVKLSDTQTKGLFFNKSVVCLLFTLHKEGTHTLLFSCCLFRGLEPFVMSRNNNVSFSLESRRLILAKQTESAEDRAEIQSGRLGRRDVCISQASQTFKNDVHIVL